MNAAFKFDLIICLHHILTCLHELVFLSLMSSVLMNDTCRFKIEAACLLFERLSLFMCKRIYIFLDIIHFRLDIQAQRLLRLLSG